MGECQVIAIISGGQTGADQGGLLAARDLGIATGGYAPKRYMTEDGPARELLEPFGLEELPNPNYHVRTRMNASAADGTVIFGNNTGGSYLTWTLCRRGGKAVYIISNPHKMHEHDVTTFRTWLLNNKIKVLNVAGNRESKNPGICNAVRVFLVHALRDEGR